MTYKTKTDKWIRSWLSKKMETVYLHITKKNAYGSMKKPLTLAKEMAKIHDQLLEYIGEGKPWVKPRCGDCGCSENHPCPGGCYWVKSDMCSACAKAAFNGKAKDKGDSL